VRCLNLCTNVTTPTMKALRTGPGLIILKRSQVLNTMGRKKIISYQDINRSSNEIKWQPDKETQQSIKVTQKCFHRCQMTNCAFTVSYFKDFQHNEKFMQGISKSNQYSDAGFII